MSDDRARDPLTRALRAGDPAAAPAGMAPPERAAMRRRVLAASRARRSLPRGWLVPAAALAALLALTLGLAWRGTRGGPLRTTARPAPPATAEAAADVGRQIQFTTNNGTLVVWSLRPRLSG